MKIALLGAIMLMGMRACNTNYEAQESDRYEPAQYPNKPATYEERSNTEYNSAGNPVGTVNMPADTTHGKYADEPVTPAEADKDMQKAAEEDHTEGGEHHE